MFKIVRERSLMFAILNAPQRCWQLVTSSLTKLYLIGSSTAECHTWKLKNTQRDVSSGSSRSGFRRISSHTSNSSGPQLEREVSNEHQLEGDHVARPFLYWNTARTKNRYSWKWRQPSTTDNSWSTILSNAAQFLHCSQGSLTRKVW